MFGNSNPNKKQLQEAVLLLTRARDESINNRQMAYGTIEANISNVINPLVAKLALGETEYLKLLKYFFALPDCSKNGITLRGILTDSGSIKDKIRSKFKGDLIYPFDHMLLNTIANRVGISCFVEMPRESHERRVELLSEQIDAHRRQAFDDRTKNQQELVQSQTETFLKTAAEFELKKAEQDRQFNDLKRRQASLDQKAYEQQLEMLLVARTQSLTVHETALQSLAEEMAYNQEALEEIHKRAAVKGATFASDVKASIKLAQQGIAEIEIRRKQADAELRQLITLKAEDLADQINQLKAEQLSNNADVKGLIAKLTDEQAHAKDSNAAEIGALKAELSRFDAGCLELNAEVKAKYQALEIQYEAMSNRLEESDKLNKDHYLELISLRKKMSASSEEMHAKVDRMQTVFQTDIANINKRLQALSGLPQQVKDLSQQMTSIHIVFGQRLDEVEAGTKAAHARIDEVEKRIRRFDRMASIKGKGLLEAERELDEAKFADQLKENYLKQGFINLAFSERTMSITDSHINLARVQQKAKAGAASLFSDRFGKFEEHYERRAGVSVAALEEKGKPSKINIIGRAGIGKSTFCKYVVHEWARAKLWQQHRYVFWIPLRNLNFDRYPAGRDYSIADVIAKECLGDFNMPDWTKRGLLKFNKQNDICWLLDGYDEAVEHIPAHLNSVFAELLEQPNRVLTSRPYYVNSVDADQTLELQGFTPENIQAYVNKRFELATSPVLARRAAGGAGSSSPQVDRADALLRYFHDHPAVSELAAVPINLDLICSVWEKNSRTDDLQQLSVAGLYTKVIQNLERRYLERHNVPGVKDFLPHEIENEAAKEMRALEVLAFYAMKEEKLLLKTKEISDTLWMELGKDAPKLFAILDIGILVGTDDTSSIEDRCFNFIHLTFQEFLAARYWTHQYIIAKTTKDNETLEELETVFNDKCFDSFWQMLWTYVASLLADLPHKQKKMLQEGYLTLVQSSQSIDSVKGLKLLESCQQHLSIKDGLKSPQASPPAPSPVAPPAPRPASPSGQALYDLGIAAHKSGKLEEAYEYYERSSRKGCVKALTSLAFYSQEGAAGKPKDLHKAKALLEQAAAGGHSRAMYNLARLYEKGIGVAQDNQQALTWYQRSLDANPSDPDSKKKVDWLKSLLA